MGIDVLHGGDNRDHLTGGSAGDALYGDDGDDFLFFLLKSGTTGVSTLDGGSGQDQIFFSATNGSAQPGAVANVLGGSGQDEITVQNSTNVVVNAGADSDQVKIQGGDNGALELILGKGIDTVHLMQFYEATTVVTIDDFAVDGNSTDTIDLVGYANGHLVNWNGNFSPFDQGFFRVAQSGADTIVQANHDAVGDDWVSLFNLKNVNADSLDVDNFLTTGITGWDPGEAWRLGTSGGEIMDGTSARNLFDALDGNDTLFGGGGNDVLHGNAGNDAIDGGISDDAIAGGTGQDQLTGGTGADSFVFYATADSAVGASDTIVDLNAEDQIDISAIDANTTQGAFGDQAFTMVVAFTHAAGQATLIYTSGTNTTALSLDTNGDAVADCVINMTGNVTAFAHIVL